MGTGFRGASVIAWAQTELEGIPAKGKRELVEGMSWRWHGRALPLEGDGAALILTASRDTEELRSRAARVVRKHASRKDAKGRFQRDPVRLKKDDRQMGFDF